jgi:hypothetical protein
MIWNCFPFLKDPTPNIVPNHIQVQTFKHKYKSEPTKSSTIIKSYKTGCYEMDLDGRPIIRYIHPNTDINIVKVRRSSSLPGICKKPYSNEINRHINIPSPQSRH